MPDLTISSPGGMQSYSIWGPFSAPLANSCAATVSGSSINFTNNTPMSTYTISSDVGILPVGYYYLRIRSTLCNSSISFSTPQSEFDCSTETCENCIGSFAPEPGKKYLLSAWVKEDGATPGTTTYTKPLINLVFFDASNVTTTLGPFAASGLIIDGWQRVEQEFTVPANAVKIDIVLSCSTGDCYFDDIRVFPYDGSMKSYVYDPVTLRLVAELDERNYATIYEYDEEGKLVRIKKETERGIMTIQESKTSVVKK
jgi:hypothetical protein